ncbi:MAG: helix-hairpin-helix domain-containing protein [Candidatus Heimdallarchaeaceae archaeon]
MSNMDITNIKGIGAKKADELKKIGLDTVEKVANASIEELTKISGVGKVTAEKMKLAAQELLTTSEQAEPKKVEPKKPVVKKAEPKKVEPKKPVVKKAEPKKAEPKKKPKTIKPKKTEKKQKQPRKLAELKETYGIIRNIVHNRTGTTGNRSILVSLYNTELPISAYVGRRVVANYPNSKRTLMGKIVKIHGKNKSNEQKVIVRFNKGVSPHILETRVRVI